MMFHNESGALYLRDRLILNAEVTDVKVLCKLGEEGHLTRLMFSQDGTSFTLPFIESNAPGPIRLNSMDPRLVCVDQKGKPTDTQFRAFLQNAVSERLRTGQVGVAFSRHGWEVLPSGAHVYVAGDRILGEIGDADYHISPAVSQVTLPDLPDESDRFIVSKHLKKMAKDPHVLILISAHLFRSLLQTPFEEVGYPLHHVLYVDGVYGSGKTTASTNFCMVFSSSESAEPTNITRVMTSHAAVREFLSDKRDVAVLADDVCTSSDPETQRKCKGIAAYVVRFSADRVPERIKVNGALHEFRCRAGVIITGEFPLEQASDLSRCAAVWVDHQMRGGELDDRLVAAAAASRFLEYFARNYDRLCAEIQTALRALDPSTCTNCSPRQQAILLELSCAFQLYLDFALEIGVLNPTEREQWQCALDRALSASLSRSNQLIEQFKRRNVTNLAETLLIAIAGESLRIAKNQAKFESSPESYAGFRRDNTIFVPLDALADLLTSTTGRVWTKNQVGQRLRACGLIEVGKENRSAKHKLPGLGRFVAIDIRTLKKQANPTSNS